MDFIVSFGPEDDRRVERFATIIPVANRCRELEAVHAENVLVEHDGKVRTGRTITAFSPATGRIMRRA